MRESIAALRDTTTNLADRQGSATPYLDAFYAENGPGSPYPVVNAIARDVCRQLARIANAFEYQLGVQPDKFDETGRPGDV